MRSKACLKNGKMVRGYLGVRLPGTVDEGVLDQLGSRAIGERCWLVFSTVSPADMAKLRAGDFITDVDTHKIEGGPIFA